MNRLWWATLNTGSPRYRIWREILDSDEVPIKHYTPAKATLGVPAIERAVGTPAVEENVEVYELDLGELGSAQIRRLAAFVSAKFITTLEQVEATIRIEGFPIRSEDVIVAFSTRGFL
jgi:hypothetical protein